MKVKIPQKCVIEKFVCDLCGEYLLQNGDGTYIGRDKENELKYHIHTTCLVELVDKTPKPKIVIPEMN